MSREQDAKVAEVVMGWRIGRPDSTPAFKVDWCMNGSHLVCTLGGFKPTTDPAADYQVLEHVREKWSQTKVCALRDELALMWSRRATERDKQATSVREFAVHGCTQYQPGDYSRAALAAIEKEREDAKD